MRRLAPLLIVPIALGAACTAGGGSQSGTSIEVADRAASGQPAAGVSTLTVDALSPLVEAGSVLLIDVRTPEEFAQGNIPGAINIPLDRFDPLQVPDAAGREVILYCRSDRRSGVAADRWAEARQAPIRHLEGGILAWEAGGQALEGVEGAPPEGE